MIKFIDTGEEQNYNLDAKISGRINLLETNSYVLDTEYEMQVASGLAHSAAIDEKGNLYTWGYNNHCQLGNGTNEDQYTPKQIMKGIKFKKIYIGSGALHNMAIDKYGNLYVWGRNGH